MAAVISSPRESTEDETSRDTPTSKACSRRTIKHFSFNYEPSKVETQLKKNIQRLNTPADEKQLSLKGGSSCSYSSVKDGGGCCGADDGDCLWEVPFQDIRDLEYVGSGGQGTVFKGIHRGQMVAVKKVNDPKQTNVYHLRKLEHDNIIKFLGVCTKEPCYCVVMEYCDGGNVYQYIRRPNVIMLPKQIVNWAEQIASGMHYLHSNMIVHRDLKSLNVLVKNGSYLKITDFGTSRVIDSHSTVMTVIGSCAWMAPELIRNEPCNDKVDVWSYGILLWELLTQEVPYKGLNHGAIMFGVGSNRLSLPIPKKCPSELTNLLNKCWDPKAKNRPSFQQILAQLDWIKEGRLLSFTSQEYLTVRAEWKDEIDTHFDSLELSLNYGQSSDDYQLIAQRKEELKHAHEVRIMYEKKLETAEKLCEQLDHCKRLIDQRQHELDRKERVLSELYKEAAYYSSTSSEDESGRNNKTIIRRRRPHRNHKDSTPEVFDSPIESGSIANDHSPSNSSMRNHGSSSSSSSAVKRSDSIITDNGTVSHAVQKLIYSVTTRSTQPNQGHGTCLPHPPHFRHRRVKSCSSSLRRKDSKSSVKSLNFHRRHRHENNGDHQQIQHDYHHSNSLDGIIGRKSDIPRRKHYNNHSNHQQKESISTSNSWNNGEDGDTESNGEEGESADEDMGEGPMSSVPTSPVTTPFRQHDLSLPIVTPHMDPPTNRKGMLIRLLRLKKQ